MTDRELQASLPEVEQYVATAGAQLSARRQQLNWTVEQVANQLNLAPRQIDALEANDFGALPGMAIARGFIRAYAKLLKIDPAPLLAAVANETTPADDLIPLRRALPSKPFSDNTLALAGKRRWLSWPVMLVVLAGLVFAAVMMQQSGWLPRLPVSVTTSGLDRLRPVAKPVQSAQSGGQSAPMTESVLPSVSNEPGVDAQAAEPAATTASPQSNAAIENGSVPVSAVAEQAFGQDRALTDTATGDSSDLLVLKMREDSWLEIRRPDNSVVLSGLIKAGDDQAIKVVQPLALTIGNASGVDASLRGTSVDLASAARSNVARLTLK